MGGSWGVVVVVDVVEGVDEGGGGGGVERAGVHLEYMETSRASKPSLPGFGEGTGGGMCGFSSKAGPRGDLARGYIRPSTTAAVAESVLPGRGTGEYTPLSAGDCCLVPSPSPPAPGGLL